MSAADITSRNRMRAAGARAAFEAYRQRTGADGTDDGLVDLIADCGHLARQRGADFAALAQRALRHWQAELLHPDGLEAAATVPEVTVTCRCSAPNRPKRRACT